MSAATARGWEAEAGRRARTMQGLGEERVRPAEGIFIAIGCSWLKSKRLGDDPVGQRQRWLVEEQCPPARELLGSGEVDASSRTKPTGCSGRPEHGEGDQAQRQGDAPVGPVPGRVLTAALQHAEADATPPARADRRPGRSSVTGPRSGSGRRRRRSPRGPPGMRVQHPARTGERELHAARRSGFQACSQVMPASRKSVPAGTSGKRTVMRAGPPGGTTKRQRTRLVEHLVPGRARPVPVDRGRSHRCEGRGRRDAGRLDGHLCPRQRVGERRSGPAGRVRSGRA